MSVKSKQKRAHFYLLFDVLMYLPDASHRAAFQVAISNWTFAATMTNQLLFTDSA